MELSRLPASFAEIKSFYIEVFRPLYDRFMNTGAILSPWLKPLAELFAPAE